MKFRRAGTEDRKAIEELLSRFQLPVDDIAQPHIYFIIAEDDDTIAGCIGIETYGTEGLLRSLAVDEEYRNKKIGRQLINHLHAYALESGVEHLHLLTETAASYFQRFGFSQGNRGSAPDAIRATKEFSILCSSRAVYMVKENLQSRPAFFPSGLRIMKKDPETGSSYWKMSSGKMSFTRFTVPPGQSFPAHMHESDQMTYVLDGKLFFDVGDETFILEKGDFIFIPSHKNHRVWTEAEGAEAVDAWSPADNKY